MKYTVVREHAPCFIFLHGLCARACGLARVPGDEWPHERAALGGRALRTHAAGAPLARAPRHATNRRPAPGQVRTSRTCSLFICSLFFFFFFFFFFFVFVFVIFLVGFVIFTRPGFVRFTPCLGVLDIGPYLLLLLG